MSNKPFMPKIHLKSSGFADIEAASFWYCHRFEVSFFMNHHRFFFLSQQISRVFFSRQYLRDSSIDFRFASLIKLEKEKKIVQNIYLTVINSYDRWNVSWRPPKHLWFFFVPKKTAWHRVIHVIDSIKWALPIYCLPVCVCCSFFDFLCSNLSSQVEEKRYTLPWCV